MSFLAAAPAIAGSNTELLTPGPLKIPPGKFPDKITGSSPTQ